MVKNRRYYIMRREPSMTEEEQNEELQMRGAPKTGTSRVVGDDVLVEMNAGIPMGFVNSESPLPLTV